jgi:hypothetical protein
MIPERFQEELLMGIDAPLPFPRPERKPLTRRQKVRLFFIDLKWSIHDFLFPGCSNE